MMFIISFVAGFVFGMMTEYVLKNDEGNGGFLDPDEWIEDDIFK